MFLPVLPPVQPSEHVFLPNAGGEVAEELLPSRTHRVFFLFHSAIVFLIGPASVFQEAVPVFTVLNKDEVS